MNKKCVLISGVDFEGQDHIKCKLSWKKMLKFPLNYEFHFERRQAEILK